MKDYTQPKKQAVMSNQANFNKVLNKDTHREIKLLKRKEAQLERFINRMEKKHTKLVARLAKREGTMVAAV